MSKVLKFKSKEEIKERGYRVVQKEDKLDTIRCNIKDRLKETGETEAGIANILGIKRQVLYKQLRNPESITLLNALKIAKMLSCSVEDIFQIGPDGWLVEYPFERVRNDICYFNIKTLETVDKSVRNETGLLYYNETTGETITYEEYRRRINTLKKEYPDQKAEKEEEFKAQFPCLYAKLTKDIGPAFRD